MHGRLDVNCIGLTWWFYFQLTVWLVVNVHHGSFPQSSWVAVDGRHCEAKHHPPCKHARTVQIKHDVHIHLILQKTFGNKRSSWRRHSPFSPVSWEWHKTYAVIDMMHTMLLLVCNDDLVCAVPLCVISSCAKLPSIDFHIEFMLLWNLHLPVTMKKKKVKPPSITSTLSRPMTTPR